MINGIYSALEDGKDKLGISFHVIMCFLRHLSEEAAFATLKQAVPFKEKITALGLDSSEVGHPPEKFANLYKKAEQMGLLKVAHAGEEGPAEYIWSAVDGLKIDRRDPQMRPFGRLHGLPMAISLQAPRQQKLGFLFTL